MVGPQLGAADGLEPEELDAELAAFYERIFTRYIERQGKHRWGDKTPLHTWHIDGMARLFPDAQFIGMLRHPGGSVGSNMTRFGHPYGRAVHHVERYDREIARQAAEYKDRFAIVRYEELVLRPEPLLREPSRSRCPPRAAPDASSAKASPRFPSSCASCAKKRR